MAGIGKMAQNAWGAMGGLAKVGAGAAAMGIGKGLKAAGKGIGKGARALDNKLVDKWNKKHDGNYYTDTRRGRLEAKLGRGAVAAGKGIKAGASAVVRGGKVARDVYKDGGKDTLGTIKKSGGENFKREVDEAKRRMEQKADAKMAGRLTLASGDIQVPGKTGKNLKLKDDKSGVDFNESVKGNKWRSNDISKINSDIINGMGGNLTKMQKENLNELNKKRASYSEAKGNLDKFNDVSSSLKDIISSTKNQEQRGIAESALGLWEANKLDKDTLQNSLDRIADISIKNPNSNAISVESFESLRAKATASYDNAKDVIASGKSGAVLNEENAVAKEKYEKQSEDIKKEAETLSGASKDDFNAITDSINKLFTANEQEQRRVDAQNINNAVSTAAAAAAAAATSAATSTATSAAASAAASAASATSSSQNAGPAPAADTSSENVSQAYWDRATGRATSEPAPAPAPEPTPAPAQSTDTGSTASTSSSGNVNVDMSGLENKLNEINSSIKDGSKSVTDAVNTTGNNITNSIGETNTALKTMSTTVTNIDTKLKQTNKTLGSIDGNLSKKDDE
jgi:hypothetical protein